MVKNIIVQPSDNISVITEYFDFNCISYQSLDFWSTEHDEFGGYQLPKNLLFNDGTLLVLSHSIFQEFINWNVSKEQLITFSKKNHIWVWNDIDGILLLRNSYNIDKQFSNLTIFVDGNAILPPQNLNIQEFPVNAFLKMPRIKFSVTDKLSCKYDFLLTTVIKSGRLHRDVLVSKLSNRPIRTNGLISQNTQDSKHTNWIGDTPHQHNWKDGYPSMDLYQQCWFEIVPETMYQYGHFYTEKTNKPIATKTPFLTVSTKGYLGYLKSLGFKTFDSLINESYDQQDSIEDRVRLMLDQAEDIIANGSEQFYHAAMPILEHNYNHLAEISGKWNHLMDAFITEQLERIGVKI